jgi:radical SAM/Cys-rich protein
MKGLPSFKHKAEEAVSGQLRAQGLDILQVNVGYRCNMSCKHCHIGAGPARTEEMDGDNIEAVLSVLGENDIGTLDITGGAPELNPRFSSLVEEARGLGRRVIVRSNLTVFFEEGYADLPEFFASRDVEVVASLPYYLEENVDRVRGSGTFGKSIDALRRLNSLGYGTGGKSLSLVYNPQGAFQAPPQEELEKQYRKELKERFGVSFDSLFTFTNMPVGRFRDFLVRTGGLEKYYAELVSSFNPSTLEGIMCKRLINVGWDGRLYDCDFNQVLGLTVLEGLPGHIRDFDRGLLGERAIAVDEHCFGCTAGQGST